MGENAYWGGEMSSLCPQYSLSFIIFAAFIILANIFSGQTKVAVDSVTRHIGERVVVCSKVFGVKSLEKITFINLGQQYPNSPLTVVVFAENILVFKEAPATLYDGKQICVTLTLKDYKGKTEIVATKPEDISVQ
jgi:DNA/RNA endonuclease YhcR with UshA esterase domain